MDTVQLSTQIRRLIAEGELETAARTLLQYLDQEGLSSADKARFQVYNQALYQVAQLNELQDQVIRGIISTEDADLKRNRLREALLEIVEKMLQLERVPPGTGKETLVLPAAPPKGKWPLLSRIIGGIVGVALLISIISKIIPDKTIQPSGCYIETGLSTEFLVEPQVFSPKIGRLPKYTQYPVENIKIVKHVTDEYFFRISDEKLGSGWVKEGVLLKSVSQPCWEQIKNKPS